MGEHEATTAGVESGHKKRTGLGPDDRNLSSEQLFAMAKPVPMPPSPFAPPEPPASAGELPVLEGCTAAQLVRGDESELAGVLQARCLGRYVVSIAGELWQYDPDRRGWWRIPEERAMSWVSRLAGARILAGTDRSGTEKTKSLRVSSSMARGAVNLARASHHWPEERGDFWTGQQVRGYRRGIAQFRDAAVIVTQTGAGQLSVTEDVPKPEHRVRAVRVLPCRWQGVPAMSDLPARCPALWRVHREWWGHHGPEEAYRRLLAVLEFFGATVLGFAPTMARAMFLYGPGGTGKSTLIQLMTRWCQPSAVASVTPQDMGINRFAPARLDGALMNVVDDLPADAIMDAGVWKSAITGGRIDIERKGRDGYGIFPNAGHLYAGNRLPTAVRANSGFWRRWLVVHYDRVFHGTTQDRPIIEELMGEMDWLMAFAVAAFLQTGGAGGRGYTEPDCHAAVMQEWNDVSDSVSAWHREAVEPVPTETPKTIWPKRSDVYRSYRTWCQESGRHPVSAQEWCSRMADLGVEFVKSRGHWRSSVEQRVEV